VLDYRPFPFRSVSFGLSDVTGAFPLEGVLGACADMNSCS
jgi:hypothetical protein